VAVGAIAVAVGVALLLAGVVSLRGTADSALRSNTYLIRVIEVERSVVDAETGLRGYELTGLPVFLQPLQRAETQLPGEASALERVAQSDGAYVSQANALADAANAYLAGYVATRLRQMAHDPAAARSAAVVLQGKAVLDNIRARTAALEAVVSARQSTRDQAAHGSADRAVDEGIVVLVLVTLMTLLLGGILGRLLLRRERERDRAALLAEASIKLDRSATMGEVLNCLAEIADRRLSDACLARTVINDETAEPQPGDEAAASGDAELLAVADADPVVAALSRTSNFRSEATASEQLTVEHHGAPLHVLVLSCRVQGQLVADAMLVRKKKNWRPGEIEEATELAFRMALAVQARGLQAATEAAATRSEQTAQTLQQSLLPQAMPSIPSCELAVRFSPAGAGDLVGGDFYDAFAVGPDRWAIVVGDVCGKGAAAAALTALARWTLRSLAGRPVPPDDALRFLNDAMLREDLAKRFITVAYLLVHVRPDDVLVTVACGGHPAPTFVPASGPPTSLAARGDLIGVWPQLRLDTCETRLAPGDTLVVYTDGVTDQGPEPQPSPEHTLSHCPPGASAADLAVALERAARGSSPTQRDDIAIVALQRCAEDDQSLGNSGSSAVTAPPPPPAP